MSDQRIEEKYVNLSKKFKIDRDDFEAQFERLTRYILQTYNFGTELVTLAFLELIRYGDIPPSPEAEEKQGSYQREAGEDQSAANAVKKPSEIVSAAIRAKEEQEARKAQEKKEGEQGKAEKKETAPKQLEGQLNIFEEEEAPESGKPKGE